MSRAQFSRELKKATGTGTTAMVTQLLGREDEQPKASSTKLKPAIHKILGWPAPADDDHPQKSADILRDQFLGIWPTLNDTEREVIEMIVAKRSRRP